MQQTADMRGQARRERTSEGQLRRDPRYRRLLVLLRQSRDPISTWLEVLEPWLSRLLRDDLPMRFLHIQHSFRFGSLEPQRMGSEGLRPGWWDWKGLLAQLTPEPEELLLVMQDCQVLICDSRAASYFWPECTSEDSPWDFSTHPTIDHWLRFVLYLQSIGVEWRLPPLIRDNEGHSVYDFTYGGSRETSTLHGSIRIRGRNEQVRLNVHDTDEDSSLIPILYSHSSIVQCFVSGYGAFSMYGALTLSGRSRAWESQDVVRMDAHHYQQADMAIEQYQERGIEYVGIQEPLITASDKVPLVRSRTLADCDTLCVPFAEDLTEESRRKRSHSGLEHIKRFGWYEHGYHLTAPPMSDVGLDEGVTDCISPVEVPLFDKFFADPCATSNSDQHPRLFQVCQAWLEKFASTLDSPLSSYFIV